MTFRLQARVQKHGTKGSWELGCCSRMYDVFSLFSLKGSEIKGFIFALKQLFVVPLGIIASFHNLGLVWST